MSDVPVLSVEDCEREFRSLLGQICDGSKQAAEELVRIYGEHILRAVRRRLPSPLRQKFDSTDFTQLVWQAVFSDPGRLTEFKTPDELMRYLAGIATYKVAEEARRRLGTAKFSIHREQSLDDPALQGDDYCSQSPPPAELASAREQFEALLRGLGWRDKQVLLMRLGGASCESIAEKLGIHARTVRKIIQRLDPRHDPPGRPK